MATNMGYVQQLTPCAACAGSGKKRVATNMGREACGPHWIHRLAAYLASRKYAL